MGERVRRGARRVVAVSAAALATLTLAACSPSTDPSPSTSTSTPSSSSSSSSPGVILDMPALASEHSKPGAIAFARFIMELIDESSVRADSTQLRALSLKGCTGCAVLADGADALRADGQHNDARATRITKSAWVAEAPGGAVVDLGISSQDVDVVDAEGKKVNVQKGSGEHDFRLTVVWRRDHWMVRTIVALADS